MLKQMNMQNNINERTKRKVELEMNNISIKVILEWIISMFLGFVGFSCLLNKDMRYVGLVMIVQFFLICPKITEIMKKFI